MSGAPVKEIAKEFGIHRVTVSEICKRYGVELRSTKRRMTSAQVEFAARRYMEGVSLATTGKEVDIRDVALLHAYVDAAMVTW